MIKKKIIIATGGTGGHVFPALSLADYFNSEDFKVIITSDDRGINYLKNYNLNIVKVPSSPLKKSNFFKLLLSLVIISYSVIKSFFFLLLNRPSIVFGMGGYSSFPICFAASILKIKFVIYENNLVLGKANKYLLPFASKIFVSYKEIEGISNKYNEKIFVIGNIIRKEIFNLKITKDNKERFKNMNILVLGGSQAAEIFAEELPDIFEKLNRTNFSIKIFQQCLKKQVDLLSNIYKKANIDYEIFHFTDKITNYYSKANLVITRSGASVLGELINVKVPFISIPLPSSADNHQLKNAEFYKKKGYGLLIEQKNIKYELFNVIHSIFNDQLQLNNILSNQRQYSDKEIYKYLRNQLEKIINEKN